MPAQIALSLVWILVGPQKRKETVKDQSPTGLLMRCYDAMQRKLKAVISTAAWSCTSGKVMLLMMGAR